MAFSCARQVCNALPSVVLVSSLLVTGCAGADQAQPRTDASADPRQQRADVDEFIVAHVDGEFLPDTSLVDWVSFPSQLSVVTINEESNGEQDAESAASGRGYVSRSISIEIGETIWSNPAIREQPIDGTVELETLGWHRKGDKLIQLVALNSPRLKVGGKYLLPLLQFGEAWSILSTRSVVAVRGDEVAERDVAQRGQSEIAHMLSDLTFDDIRDLLASTAPYEAAAENWHLPPLERWAVVRQTENPPTP